MRRIVPFVAAAVGVAALAAAPATAAPSAGVTPAGAAAASEGQVRCEFIGSTDGSACMLPFPNDYFTRKRSSTRTGRIVRFQNRALPANQAGQHIRAAPYAGNDGFSPGSPIVVRIPGLDTAEALRHTAAASLSDLGRYKDKKAPVVVLDADTGRRWPIWVELDSNALTPGTTTVLIHPARNFVPSHRYIVAMRRLRDATGGVLAAPPGFRVYRDGRNSSDAVVNRRRDHFEHIFRTLHRSKIGRSNLYLAWDFTVASQQNIAGRMLSMRDRALDRLGDDTPGDSKVQGKSPAFSIDNVVSRPVPGLARAVRGHVDVPCFLAPGCGQDVNGVIDLKPGGNPRRTGTYRAPFICSIPDRALDEPARPTLFGHGLFGQADRVLHDSEARFASTYNFVMCAADQMGLSDKDLVRAATVLADFGKFPIIGDRLQQALLNEVYLGRLMAHPEGLLGDPAFHVDRRLSSRATFTSGRVFYRGVSLGGILGGAFTAIAPDTRRSHLVVNAMNFSVLLQRSEAWRKYGFIADAAYPDRVDQALSLSVVQMLWDRSEANGYAPRMTGNPLPHTPKHKVLMDVAFGDQTVTTYQANVLARTIGARKHVPVLYPGRWPGVELTWGIDAIRKYPYKGSALFYWDAGPDGWAPDKGNPPPLLTNTFATVGNNPHGTPGVTPASQRNGGNFLRDPGESKVKDVCGEGPCFMDGFTGP